MLVLAALAALLNAIPPARRRAVRRLNRLFIIASPELTSISTYIPSRNLALALITIFNVLVLALITVLLQVLTAPVSGHMLARTAYRTGQWDDDHASVDELGEDLEAAGFHNTTDGEPDPFGGRHQLP